MQYRGFPKRFGQAWSLQKFYPAVITYDTAMVASALFSPAINMYGCVTNHTLSFYGFTLPEVEIDGDEAKVGIDDNAATGYPVAYVYSEVAVVVYSRCADFFWELATLIGIMLLGIGWKCVPDGSALITSITAKRCHR